MQSKKTEPPFRFISKKISFLLLTVASVFQILRIIAPSGIVLFYDSINFIDPNTITLIFWILLLIISLIEILNILLINHKGNLIKPELLSEIIEGAEEYCEETLVLIPALDEEDSIEEAINIGKNVGIVLVIDDGSSDNTRNIALNNAEHVISHSRNMGLARAISNGVKFGLEKDFTNFVIFDADCQYTREDLIKVVKLLRNSKADLVMGSRLSGQIEYMPRIKKFGNWLFSKILTYITKIPISDGQTGLRAFTSTFASNVQFRGSFTYTQEMLFEASKHRFKVLEIPIGFNERKYGESRLMRHALDYAVRAWSLNLQILAEYNPLKFAMYTLSIIFVLAFLSNNGVTSDLSNFTAITILGMTLIMFLFGIYASIIIRKIHEMDHKDYFKIIK